jgi:hypothetical protein
LPRFAAPKAASLATYLGADIGGPRSAGTVGQIAPSAAHFNVLLEAEPLNILHAA